jgi:hypothetical protein
MYRLTAAGVVFARESLSRPGGLVESSGEYA